MGSSGYVVSEFLRIWSVNSSTIDLLDSFDTDSYAVDEKLHLVRFHLHKLPTYTVQAASQYESIQQYHERLHPPM